MIRAEDFFWLRYFT